MGYRCRFGAFCLAFGLLGPPFATGDESKDKAEKAMAEMMTRWNKAAEGMTAVSPIGVVNFDWTADRFPHPTYKGGSTEAYGTFARTLVKFLDGKGTFDYLAENNLLTAELRFT